MRPFLALDTSTDHLALAVGDVDERGAVIAAEDFPAPRAANTIVLAAAERLLASAGLSVRDLTAVACGRGPGSFTGVRIGVATAKGLAHGLGVPLVGFSTLDAIARRAGDEGLIGAVGDAMRGEVYPALFRAHAGTLERLSLDTVALPARVAGGWLELGEPLTLIGAGLTRHREVFEAALGTLARIAPEPQWVPNGRSLIEAAWAAEGALTLGAVADLTRADAVRIAHPQLLLPVYTRLSDAEEAERLRLGSAAAVPDSGVAGPEAGGAR